MGLERMAAASDSAPVRCVSNCTATISTSQIPGTYAGHHTARQLLLTPELYNQLLCCLCMQSQIVTWHMHDKHGVTIVACW